MARRAGIKVGVVGLATGMAVLLGAAPAGATSCPMITDEEAFARSDTVFVGTATGHEVGDRSEGAFAPTAWTLTVTEVHKGTAHATQGLVTVWPEGAGPLAREPGPWLVFARNGPVPGDPGLVTLHSDVCAGTRAVAQAPVPPSFGAARPPLPGRAGEVDLGGRAGRLVVLVGAGLVLATALALTWRIARRRARSGPVPRR